MSITATSPDQADVPLPASQSSAQGPICALCPDPGAAEQAFECEFCGEPVCGYCVDSDCDNWLCPDCGRRAQLA